MDIKLENVSYKYPSLSNDSWESIRELNCMFETGKWLSVIGQTGSGKSTLMKLLKGLIAPTAGRLLINGQENKLSKKGNAQIIQEVGLVFQYPEHQLFETTVLKDLAFGPKNQGVKKEEINDRTKVIIELVGLSEAYFDKAPFELSGGEKRRVAIATVLMMNPEVLILDEPTAGLDPQGSKLILQLVHDWQKAGGGQRTVIFVTHQMNEVAEYSDEVLVMNDGEIVFQENPIALFREHDHELKAFGLDIPDSVKLLKLFEHRFGKRIEVHSLQEEVVLEEVVAYFTKQGDDLL
ncbi:energy-coupling factor transporter ATPase [Viridibacillus sp. YIM B01967]|uniref:Energy-coupling factor transporter ATPase n=1 Tax=Viridibacillus soli TaxID=2798301 RepID=A0ABS1H714_9BACL|nr:ATP-binding cassette domain-containing protein [Viridibacillus soli]MBK3495190.1 energy-coupling factor transporter ATPase [Viridibacillus soli]